MDCKEELEKRGAPFKRGLLQPYLDRYEFEDEEWLPSSEYYFSSDDEDHESGKFFTNPRIRHPNPHELVKTFLKQVRESNGYDVDCYPPPWLQSPFRPMNLSRVDKFTFHYVMSVAHAAINEINTLTGKHFELVEVEKAVDTTITFMLLTLGVKDANDGSSTTLRAMMCVPYGAVIPGDCILEEWMYNKPSPPATDNLTDDMDSEKKKAKIGEGENNIGIFSRLEESIMQHIVSFLDRESAVSLSLVSKSFKAATPPRAT